jgi:hypothetical protein
MAPHGRKPLFSSVIPSRDGPSRVAKEALEATENYENIMPEDDKVSMSALKDEFFLVHEFKEDVKVDFQVRGMITELIFFKTRKSKFFHTLELYWHVKTMVSLKILPKDEDFHQLKGRMEMLEV